jgi:hypothetical protein
MVRMDAAGSSSWPLGWDSSSQEDAVAVAHQALGGPIIVSPAPVLEPRRAAAGEPPEPKIHEPAVPHFSLRLNQPLHQPLNQPAAPPVGPPSTDRPDRGSSRGAVAAPFHDDVARPVPREEGGSAATADLDDQVIAGTTAAADSQLDASPGLPLFESLWFRQCAPQSGTARIVDRLLQKLSPAVPAVLHFCQDRSSRAASHLVCTQVAWELSRRGQGSVLLVDADYAHREISRQLGNVYLPGLSEWLNLGEPIDALVRPTGVEHLDWLPSGSGDISFRQIAGGRWAEISLQLRRRFQWICVHAGAAQDRVTTTWGRFCDFSYLITSMEDTHGPSTKQMVDQLRRAECRLSGLITID